MESTLTKRAMGKRELIKNEQCTLTEQIVSIPVSNAGLVIMQGYFETIFEKMGIVSNGNFISDEVKQKAIHCLQFLATGQKQVADNDLYLNKVLCAYKIEEPIDTTTDFKDTDIVLMRGLINAMISYWPENGSTTFDDFRGNWLIRDAIITEKENQWDLVIEKKAYDVLLQQSPFSFSTIKHQWMEKPLYVTWNF